MYETSEKENNHRILFNMLAQIFKMTLLGVIVLSVFLPLINLNCRDYFPIKTVRIYGVNHVDQQEVQDLLLPLVNQGFFTINVEYYS